MKHIKGDLLKLTEDGCFDIIVHGCNCFCIMGAGIAHQIKHKYPQAYAVDNMTSKGNIDKLGNITVSVTDNGCVIINGYTQFEPGANCDYEAIRSVFRNVKKFAEQIPNARIGYPAIGAGIAGGNWSTISAIIDEELEGLDHTFVEYQP